MLLVTCLLVGRCCTMSYIAGSGKWCCESIAVFLQQTTRVGRWYVATSRIAIVDMFPTSRHVTSTLMNLIKIPSHETFYRLECGWGWVELIHAWRWFSCTAYISIHLFLFHFCGKNTTLQLLTSQLMTIPPLGMVPMALMHEKITVLIANKKCNQHTLTIIHKSASCIIDTHGAGCFYGMAFSI